MRLVIDLTPYEEHAQVIYIGLLQHSRVLPLVWKVMPGQTKWDQGLWECIDKLFERLAPHLGETDCTIMGDSAFGCFPMVRLCQKYRWHYLFRICEQHTCEHWSSQGRLLPTCPVSDLVNKPGMRFYGHIRLWQEDQIETNLSACWENNEEEALFVISDRPACRRRIADLFRVQEGGQPFCRSARYPRKTHPPPTAEGGVKETFKVLSRDSRNIHFFKEFAIM